MEDCGTVGAVLYPWHTSSIYFCGVLGVTYLQYLPYAFMSYLAPVAAMLCALTGFGIFYSNRELADELVGSGLDGDPAVAPDELVGDELLVVLCKASRRSQGTCWGEACGRNGLRTECIAEQNKKKRIKRKEEDM